VPEVEFTQRQLDAIDIGYLGQDLCVVAGPGSGKTTVLVERFRRLVIEAGIPPARILAITFTEKAATNMKQKLAEALHDRPGDRRQLERAWVSTVHGFCMRLLRENAVFAGIDPDFRVMDERQTAALQAVVVNTALDALFEESPDTMRRLMKGLANANVGAAVLEIYDAVRASGVPLEALRSFPAPAVPSFDELLHRARALRVDEVTAWAARHAQSRNHFQALDNFQCNLRRLKRNTPLYEQAQQLKELVEPVYRRVLTEYYATERATLVDVLLRFESLYRERKQAQAALDYSDLEDFTVRLLEDNAAVRERVCAQFDQVLMDEFQDTNGLQAKLLELVRPPNRFYAVGDINQSIYGFRHAEPDVFRRYRAEVQRVAELTENWRSRPDILKAVSTVLRDADGIEERPLIAGREFAPKTEPSVELLVTRAPEADRALELEAQWVARRILDCGRAFGDVAVLLRNSEVISAFTDAFDGTGIPYLVSRGKGFYDSREVVDLVHLLRVLVNPRDEISMAAVLRSPLVEISDEALLRFKLETDGFDPAEREKLERFENQLRVWRAARDYTSFDRLLARAIDESGYPFEPGSRAGANIEKFLAMAREASSRLTLAEFVDELEMARASDPREPDAPPEDSVNAVRILTVHAAKGLEFPVVFLAAMHKGIDTSLGSLSYSPRLGLGARWRNPVTGEDKDDLFQHAIRQERKQRETEEGNRLLYVAMTRAEEHLVLSYSRTDTAPKNWAGTVEQALGLDLLPDGVARVVDAGFPLRVLCTAERPQRAPRAEVAESRELAIRVPRPAMTDQHDSNATVTAVTMFDNCPRRWFLASCQPLPNGRGSETLLQSRDHQGAVEIGLQVHALLAGTPLPDAAPESLEMADRFHRSPLGRRAARATRIEREYDFLLAVEDVILRGQIDLWFEEAGELILVDYKTDRVTSAEAYATQLRLYALALERIAGRLPDHAYVYLLRPDVAVPVDLSPLFLHAAAALVRDFREAQSQLEFPLKEGEQCFRCPWFRGLCPSRMGDVIHPAAIHGDDLRGDEARLG
jgi:ATP-dependent helicase/nuclease subunit A